MPKIDKVVINKRLKDYDKALKTFASVLKVKKDKEGVYLDASLHRFMYCYEMTWKILRRFLRMRDVDVNSPVITFREAYSEGWISDKDAFENMITDRNLITHEYHEEKAKEIYKRLPLYLKAMQNVRNKLNEICQKELI